MKLWLFGMFNSELERELSEESAPLNDGKMIATLFWTFLLGQSYMLGNFLFIFIFGISYTIFQM
jgi:hypothetical protein